VVAQKIAADAADGTGIIKGSAVLTGLIADKITGNVFDPAAVIDSSAIAAGGGISNKITGNLVNRTVVINGAAGNVCDAADKIGIDFPGQGRLPGIVNFSACRTDIVIFKIFRLLVRQINGNGVRIEFFIFPGFSPNGASGS